MVKKIILIRHGSTKLNSSSGSSPDRIRGWQDVPLDDRGVQEAHKSAKELKGLNITALFSSDLGRSSSTAAIISAGAGIPFTRAGISPLFRPWNLGQFNGQDSKKSAPFIQKYAAEYPSRMVPGGESFHSFEARFFHGLRMLCSVPGLPALVTHYRCLCLLESWQKAGFLPNGSIDHVNFSKQGDPPGHVKDFDVPVERIPR